MLSNYLSTEEMRAASEEQTDHGSEISEEIEFQLNQVVGTYEIRPGYAIEISIQNDSLNVLQKWDKSSYNLIRIHGNTFQLPGNEKLAFTFSEIVDGSYTKLMMVQNGRETACNKIPTIDLDSINKNEFMGKYYSEELDVIYDISIKTNFLVVTISNNEPQQITPYGKDQFSFDHYLLNFQRHDDSVTGFKLDAGRVKNLFFRKL
jgi:hypothetical protein